MTIEQFLINENRALKKAGEQLCAAANYVIHNSDGVHRLSLATANWFKTIADEGERGKRYKNEEKKL
jgi:hypothetical protein